MTYLVMGTREKHYRVETRDELTAWVDDEIETMNQGWLPISSELEVQVGRTLFGLSHKQGDAVTQTIGVTGKVYERTPHDGATTWTSHSVERIACATEGPAELFTAAREHLRFRPDDSCGPDVQDPAGASRSD